MERLMLDQAAKLIGAEYPSEQTDAKAITGAVIDNRAVTEGCLFFAIKGERFDGHDFVLAAEQAGAAAVVVERMCEVQIPQLIVADTRKALRDLAAGYREMFHTFVAGITGSVGKTSTKDMVYAVLSRGGKTLKTQGNLNNEIGLPRTVLGLDSSYKNAVIEMGMSARGEISRLTQIAKPNVGVITNIGVSHIENLGSRENILRAKLEITDGMRADAPLILNGDDDMLRHAQEFVERDIIYYGIDNTDADVIAANIREEEFSTLFEIKFYGKTIDASIPAIGRHNIYNALAAFAVGLVAEMDPELIVEGLRDFAPSSMRQNIVRKGDVTVIEDCYNASPDSMEAALSVLETLPGARKIAVLGDMLELGENSRHYHELVGEKVVAHKVDVLYCYGEQASFIASRAAALAPELLTECYRDKEALANMLAVTMQPDDVILFKGSRGMRLEEIIFNIWPTEEKADSAH